MRLEIKLWYVLVILFVLQDLIMAMFGKYVNLNYFDELVLIFALLLFTMIFIVKKNKITLDKYFWINSILIFYSFVLMIINNVSANVGFVSIFYFFKYFLIFLIAYNIKFKYVEIEKYVGFLEKMFYVVGVLGLVNLLSSQRLFNLLGLPIYERYGFFREHSIFFHPVTFGWLASIFALYFITKYFIFKDKKYIFSFLFAFGLLILSSSRKSLIGFMIVLVIIVCFYLWRFIPFQKYYRYALFTILFGLSLLYIFYPFVNYIFEETITEYSQPNVRMLMYETSFSIFKDYFPFGVGLGKFGDINSLRFNSEIYSEYGIYDTSQFITDAMYPALLGSWGFLGFSIYIIFIVLLIIGLHKGVIKSVNDKLKFLYLFGIILLLESFIENIASQMYFVLIFLILVFGYAGMMLSLTDKKQIDNKKIIIR